MLAVVDHPVQARLCAPREELEEAVPVTATLRYSCGQPLSAYLIFPETVSLDGCEVVWEFARSLLAAGLRVPAGGGDVHVWPCGPDRTMIELRSPLGTALVDVDSIDVRCFLARSYEAVAPGEEARLVDIDAALTSLLGGR
ncbi:SsgA family sporulation/cell division regulator [Streptomyces sp. GC420]|uniref:SsgA family sporulation/cell division regulator n=1 Tax=Streptomyces sp. GC420 TaxID=2697568 RepID=UPI0014150CD0|nr:SsgA family sporulation/cell division regulator [Streptomyces sp. GC420]NBM15997.1 SsgA family sporulation/cell division regulator [Streptomyces sp. GC420]